MKRLARMVALGVAASVSACGNGSAADAGPPIDAQVDTGSISLTWAITDGDDTISCDDVGGLSVSLVATPVGGVVGIPDAFGCAGGAATTRQIGQGTYDVRVELRAAGGSLAAPQQIAGVEVTAGADRSLGQLVFQVVPEGGFSFTLASSATAGNCAEVGQDGAGITALSIELRDRDGVCVPTTFAIAAGAEGAAGTYVSDCDGATHGCIHADQVIEVAATRSGPHTLEVSGARGERTCYSRSSQFIIPGNQLSRDLGALNLLLAPIAGCDPNAPDAGVDREE